MTDASTLWSQGLYSTTEFCIFVGVQLGQGGLACNKSKGTTMADSKEFTNLPEREKLGPGSNVRTECVLDPEY